MNRAHTQAAEAAGAIARASLGDTVNISAEALVKLRLAKRAASANAAVFRTCEEIAGDVIDIGRRR